MKNAPILSLLACLTGLPVQADDPHRDREGLTAADWQEMTEARFRAADRNRDGLVTADEQAQRPHRVLRRLQKAPSAEGERHVLLLPPPPLEDSDGDGVVTQTEAVAAAQARFQAFDADGDGQLGPAELPPPPAFPPGY